jgi:hypothetical protein
LGKSYGTCRYTECVKCGRFSGTCSCYCIVSSLFRSARGSCSLREDKNRPNEAIPMFRTVQITISVLFWGVPVIKEVAVTLDTPIWKCPYHAAFDPRLFVCSFVCLFTSAELQERVQSCLIVPYLPSFPDFT